MHVHENEAEGLAGGQRGAPGRDGGGTIGRDACAMTKPREQRSRQERIDLVVLGDQDREAAGRCCGVRLADLVRHVARAIEGLVRSGEARGERGRPHRLDQITSEARRLERRQIVARGWRHQHDASRNARGRERLASSSPERVVYHQRTP